MEAGADNAFVQYDIHHAQRTVGELAAAMHKTLPCIGHIQVADNPGRHEPGSGEIDCEASPPQLPPQAWASWARPWQTTRLIQAGHQLFVYMRGKMPEAIASSSATQCLSVSGVAERADIIILMVLDTPDVDNALFGDKGIAAGLRPSPGNGQTLRKVVVDMTFISSIAAKTFAKNINALACDYRDAPVSGGEVGVKSATLCIRVGGGDAAFETVKLLFELMGKTSRWWAAIAMARAPTGRARSSWL